MTVLLSSLLGNIRRRGMRINFPARQTFRSGDYERLHAKVGFL